MTNLAHIAETALLVLIAYVLGCALGYGLHRLLHAAQGTRIVLPQPPEPVPEPAPRRVPTPAARLAAAASDDPPEPPQPIAAPPPPPADPRPPALSAPRGGTPDKLQQIKGIGPKIEASLHALGIYHLDQIAAWDRANIDWVDARLAFKGRIRREQWVAQAERLLSAPDRVLARD
ncbi:NADH:ubiquinone oxidoreductase [Devosia sp. FKR38]|uniref:NADH:ubiquinone oxidoreductase n=1 Tax=Devosia sp. FKR38 TaxID=2562312 RepID=UPI0010C0D17C|nr:NADH:ubiquinone oxidoreductase [Devosia sp. FKR38]